MTKPEQARQTQSVDTKQSVEILNIKDLFKGNPGAKAGLAAVQSYHDTVVAKSGIPLEQIDSVATMTAHISKAKKIDTNNSPGSLNIYAAKINQSSGSGMEIVGGFQTVDQESIRFGKFAKHVEQKWGESQDEAIAGLMHESAKEGYKYLILEVPTEEVKILARGALAGRLLIPEYTYVQPNGDSPVTGLEHVYIPLQGQSVTDNRNVVPMDAILGYYKSWAGNDDKAVELMRQSAVNMELGEYEGQKCQTVRLKPPVI